MVGKRTCPDQIAEVIAMREAGYTLAAIVERLGLSISTVTRICTQHKAKPGALSEALLEKARKDIREEVEVDEGLRHSLRTLIIDNAACNTILRQKMLETMEQLNPIDTKGAALTMRALVAASTLVKNTTDSIRVLIPDSTEENGQHTVLQVVTISPDEVEAIRQEQELEADEIS